MGQSTKWLFSCAEWEQHYDYYFVLLWLRRLLVFSSSRAMMRVRGGERAKDFLEQATTT